jgi:hypothetical protein
VDRPDKVLRELRTYCALLVIALAITSMLMWSVAIELRVCKLVDLLRDLERSDRHETISTGRSASLLCTYVVKKSALFILG